MTRGHNDVGRHQGTGAERAHDLFVKRLLFAKPVRLAVSRGGQLGELAGDAHVAVFEKGHGGIGQLQQAGVRDLEQVQAVIRAVHYFSLDFGGGNRGRESRYGGR